MMDMIYSISVFSADYLHMARELKKIKDSKADMIHIDVMDGSFVELYGINQKWMETIHEVCEKPMDVHFMTAVNEKKIGRFDKDYVKTMLFHPEAVTDSQLKRAVRMAKDRGKRAGIVLSPETEANRLLPYLADIDEILIMTAYPGRPDSVYLPFMTDKIRGVKQLKENSTRNILLSADGGITENSALDCIRAGAEKIIVGRCFYRSPNIIKRLNEIRA